MRTQNWLGTLIVTATATLMLSGCASDPELSDLKQAPSAADVLPTAITPEMLAPLEADSVRYVGEGDGVQIWIAKGKSEQACFVAATETKYVSSCAGPGATLSFSGHVITLTTNNTPEKAGHVKVGSNFTVSDS